MRKGFVRDKETAMPNGAKDGDTPEEMGYIHPKTGVFYEIHTRLFSTESSAYGYLNRAFSDVFAHPSKVEVQGQSIFTLEETHHLFYLLCHSFKHFLHGGVGIRQICDMVQMIRVYGRKIDWEMFWQLCEEYHMTCFCINLLDIGERYLGFSYEASGAVRAAKKLHPDSEALLIDILDAGSFGKSSAGRIHSANITLYAAETGAEKHTAGGIWKSLVPEASYMKNKYLYAARYPFRILSERWKNGTFSEIINDWKWIFGYSARYKGAIVFYTILGILSTSLGLVGSVAGKYLIDIITGYQIQKLLLLLCIMIGSTVFSLGFESVINRISTKLGIAINNDIQADIFDKIVDADWLEISKYANGSCF